MRSKLLISSIVVFLLVVGFFVFFDSSSSDKNNDNNEKTEIIKFEKNPDPNVLVIGNPDAEITIVEYADFKCPECGDFHQNTGKKLREEYINTGKAKIIFRPFPVYSQDGARALIGSYCAQEQDKFVEYHDAIFDYMWVNHFEKRDFQKAIDTVLIDQVMKPLLTEIDMSFDAYTNCLKSEKYEKAYLDAIDLAAPDEIQGTPSFIINNQKIVGSQPYNIFKTVIEIGN